MTSPNFSVIANLETIVNPVTGDRMTILHPSHQSQGNYAKIRFDLPPGAKGSPLHYHTEMDETFTVIEGCLEMEVGQKGNRRTLQPGESLHVPPGMHHSFCNASDDWVTFMTENLPAAGFEQFIRGMYGLAIDGKVNSEGMPTNLLQFAMLLKLSDTIPVGIRAILFSSIINTLVWVAQVCDVDDSLVKYWR
ncbi:MAG: cupin domain-containing protein [Richelia sp. RM2_1_2]|nr:cupin domain-containing protein [Richelia sp. SM2_1_7]NJM18983.1 cupin domain-containing protein [Richelia sp. SM1_7_0]NJN09187.1 cupin domain-containing protein [Richelia sp. RM1_1_1]NJO30927.1 cupin domain-containing protein [Richelia sp. SL_2_1]NJO58527.1 cupin domain-containing protein [Richelia sp. RM2_1_2]